MQSCMSIVASCPIFISCMDKLPSTSIVRHRRQRRLLRPLCMAAVRRRLDSGGISVISRGTRVLPTVNRAVIDWRRCDLGGLETLPYEKTVVLSAFNRLLIGGNCGRGFRVFMMVQD